MNHDVLMMQKAIDGMNKGEDIRLHFTYLDDDKTHPGLYGVKVSKDLA
jgi:hypothetical protein